VTAPLFTCQKTLLKSSLPLATGLIARSIDKKEDSTHPRPRVNLPFAIFEDFFYSFSQPPIRALPQPCHEPAQRPGPRGTPGVCSIRANRRSDESARVSGLATGPSLDRPIVTIAAAGLKVKRQQLFLRNRHGFSPGASLHRSYKPYGSYRTYGTYGQLRARLERGVCSARVGNVLSRRRVASAPGC
jgi:hypothetical protein